MSPIPNLSAYLTGTFRQPAVVLFFERGQRHAVTGLNLIEWVKKAPGRRWDPTRACWVVDGFGPGKDPEALLRKAGFTVDISGGVPGEGGIDPSLSGIISLTELMDPVAKASVEKHSTVLVRPRFLGWAGTRDLLGPGATWDKERQRFEAPLTDILIHGDPKPGLIVDADTVAKARALIQTGPKAFGHGAHSDEAISEAASSAAASSGVGDGHDEEAVQRLVDVVGDIPDWLGMTPRPYQRLGALALLTGRGLLADPTGLGKTLQVIGAYATKDVKRGVIVVPPVVVTHWGREIERCGLAFEAKPKPKKATRKKKAKEPEGAAAPAEAQATPSTLSPGVPAHLPAPPGGSAHGRGSPDETSVTGVTGVVDGHGAKTARTLVTFRSGRKEPELPETGIVVVPDSLLSARPALRDALVAWNPDAIAYDEAHRARTWRSQRSEAIRDMYDRIDDDALRIASTATPIFSGPHELAPLLALTGHLDSVFGGYSNFIGTYCKRDHFNRLVPNKEALPHLHAILAEQVWVRRDKEEVLKDLPSKSRTSMYVDADLSGFRAAHREVIDKITEWLDEFHAANGRLPEEAEAESWARQRIGLISPLRKAAGVAKVPVALDIVAEWLDENVTLNADGTFTCDRPLLMWAHHQEVIAEMRTEIEKHVKAAHIPLVGVLDGSTSVDAKGRLVDWFQEGRLPVLIASITAAGVGVTLTRGSDALFVETDWSPPNVTQAEDRQWRIGQENHVQITTLVAPGTLDQRIQSILARKSQVIGEVTGDHDAVAVAGNDDMAPWEIVSGLIAAATEKWKPPSQRANA